MVYRPCDPYTSCGISNCFRLLSRTQRQIAHALLTRPPLSVLLHSVRLECVMHAASVHPEPGSNSLKNGYIFAPLRKRLHTFLRVAYSSFSYFLSFSMCFLTRFPRTFQCFGFLLFNFQRPSSRRDSFVATFIFYHVVDRLSRPFSKVF